MMKKIISALIALILVSCIACAAFAEAAETELVERGFNEDSDFDFENGNFEGVTYDGSIRAKIYVNNSWAPFEDNGITAGCIWWKANPEIEVAEVDDADAGVMNIGCVLIDPESYDGAATLEAMKDFLDANGFNYDCEICTINGIRAMVFNSEGKYTLGAFYELPEGLFKVYVDGITNEELENEAVLTLCSLTTEE